MPTSSGDGEHRVHEWLAELGGGRVLVVEVHLRRIHRHRREDDVVGLGDGPRERVRHDGADGQFLEPPTVMRLLHVGHYHPDPDCTRNGVVPVTRSEIVWTPPPDVRERSRVGQYMAWLEEHRGLTFDGYHELWQWSVDDLDGFWGSFTEWIGVRWRDQPSAVLADRSMPGAVWFPGGTLNWAEQALAPGESRPDDVAIVARSQTACPA